MHIQISYCCTVFNLCFFSLQPLLASEDRNPLGHGSTSRLDIYVHVCMNMHLNMHM